MTAPTHAAIGFLISQAFVAKGWIPGEYARHAAIVGAVGGVLPDIDILAFWRGPRHRINSPFHMPVLWGIAIVGLLQYLAFVNYRLSYAYVLLLGAGVLSHFVLDSSDFSSGIPWLWPLTKKRFHFWKYTLPDARTIREVLGMYKRNPAVLMELAIDAVTLIIFRRYR